MRVLLAPDKFKGTFTAAEVCAHLARGIGQARPDWRVDSLPLADGGEGTLDVLAGSLGATRVSLEVRGPLGEKVAAEYAVTPDGTAVLESARFCGLGLVPEGRRDPMRSSSEGLGQAVASALDAGARRFLIGLGGTATMDGGAGMALSLGFRLEGEGGRRLGGAAEVLASIARIDASMAHPSLALSRITVLCDVTNPLLGPRGAARVFAPQKGARLDEIEAIERGLSRLVGAVAAWKGVRVEEVASAEGAGAAGGLGMGAAAFLGARLERGAIFIARQLLLSEKMAAADAVVTGEGRLDAQTAGGKVVAAVLEEASKAGRPAVLVTGGWDGALPEPRPAATKVVAPDHESVMKADDLIAAGRKAATLIELLAKA